MRQDIDNLVRRNAVTVVEIMIVDDWKEWRIRLRRFLELTPGFRVVAEAADGLEAVEKAAQLLPDTVLLDIAMPLLNGIEAAPRIKRASPHSEIIFLTQEADSDIRTVALATGAAAYLLKTTSINELRRTIEKSLLNRFRRATVPCVIPMQELHLPGSDSPYQQGFSAWHQESQTAPNRNPSRPEACEQPGRPGYSNHSFPENG